ncbi:hypothetical protein V8648_004849 [Escherichia coli]|uniref:hypothetical protein n=2 Tax=Escherichia coli TaxID=562 RepID=UPI0002637356|nr:hypothetical protein [Escherichia coli]EIO0894007.1 hypothetical protein [Salmonella enterica subsp. enterica serovar Weltevreden]HDQ6825173.1 hypothetical protein [Escherichia coli O146:H21]HDQ6897462.1 hypothetical protein [Escherichia coli O174:H8]EEC7454439.1 hypothetical protein [Escherichia coli]EEC7616341.1 hypothetical protein [Escherichia coli]
MTFQTTITEVCTYIGDNWMIDPYPPQELLEGYFHLISKEYKNQHFSMYGFIMNETLYIKGCVFNELNGEIIHIPLNKDYREIARLIKRKVISQKKYLLAVVRNRA